VAIDGEVRQLVEVKLNVVRADDPKSLGVPQSGQSSDGKDGK
jgi:hypothetical protein